MARILLAEDDDSLRQFLAIALRKVGHEVEAVRDGEEALDAFGDKAFDLLLADIVMPGIDGIELARRATEKRPSLRVMFITGFAAVAMSRRNPTRHNTRLLSKPFHLKDLVDQVEKLLAS